VPQMTQIATAGVPSKVGVWFGIPTTPYRGGC
jgi:hypothetical protein